MICYFKSSATIVSGEVNLNYLTTTNQMDRTQFTEINLMAVNLILKFFRQECHKALICDTILIFSVFE